MALGIHHLSTGDGARTWVVLPTYNESATLEPLVATIQTILPRVHILVVDDDSPDGTGEIADALSRQRGTVSVMHRTKREGLGAAYRAGFAYALQQPGCTDVVQMDSDLSHDPGDLPRLLHELERGADLVIGSRYVRHGSTPGWSRRRRLLSRGGSLFSRLMLGLPYRDLTGGYKAWRRSLLAQMPSDGYANGYGFQIEMTHAAHRAGARVVEIPITFAPRVAGVSKMSGGIAVEALSTVVRLRMRRNAATKSGSRGTGGGHPERSRPVS